ncbi:MAG: hypothetical protein IKM46_09350 [Clostridia bacterium]|nr:hypothetical protein [Clostridia bacterium]
MKIDKKTLDSLLSLPDDKLIMMLRVISGGEFPKKAPDDATISGLRQMLGAVTDADLLRASELIGIYKKGKKR